MEIAKRLHWLGEAQKRKAERARREKLEKAEERKRDEITYSEALEHFENQIISTITKIREQSQPEAWKGFFHDRQEIQYYAYFWYLEGYDFSSNCFSAKEWAALANIMSVTPANPNHRNKEKPANKKMWRRVAKDLEALLAEKVEGIRIKSDDEGKGMSIIVKRQE